VSGSRANRRAWAAAALVALIAFAAFLPALRAGFVTWDDNRNFVENPAYRGLGWPQLRWMWTSFHMGHYVPLAWMTLGLDFTLWGMNPLGYHLQNLVLHAANAVLVFELARRVFAMSDMQRDAPIEGSVVPAAVAALLFAIHPLRVESVAWITERRDMLSLLFCLTSVLLYLRHARDVGGSRRWYVLSLTAFGCALLSKATSVSIPIVLLVLNVYPLRRLRARGSGGIAMRQVVLELLPYALLSGAVAVLSIVALRPPAQLSVGAKLAVSAYSLMFYLAKTVWPTGLAPLYEMPKTVNPLAARYVASYVVVVVVTSIALAARRRWPGLTTAWLVFLVVLLPMLGLVQNGPQIAADRYTYHAAPALAILAGAALWLWRTVPNAARLAVATAVLAVFATLTWRQTAIWHDSDHLWAQVLRVDSTSSVAQIAMGDLLIAQNRLDEAADHYTRGVTLDPSFAIGFNNLGVILARQGRLAEATARYAHAVALRPTYADAHNNWGIALSQQGDFRGAIEHFTRAIALDPHNADAEVNLGNAFVRQQRADSAIAHYERAVSLRPDDAQAYLNWGVALAQLGRMTDAIARFRQALAIEPANADARAYLARAEQLESGMAREDR
jgi:tetratricopeptide (TPR) repeat protein